MVTSLNSSQNANKQMSGHSPALCASQLLTAATGHQKLHLEHVCIASSQLLTAALAHWNLQLEHVCIAQSLACSTRAVASGVGGGPGGSWWKGPTCTACGEPARPPTRARPPLTTPRPPWTASHPCTRSARTAQCSCLQTVLQHNHVKLESL